MIAECKFAPCLAEIQSGRRFEPLAVVINKGNQRCFNAEGVFRKFGQLIKVS